MSNPIFHFSLPSEAKTNIFNFSFPNDYYCYIRQFVISHSEMEIDIHSTIDKKECYKLLLIGVHYIDCPVEWRGANFCCGLDATALYPRFDITDPTKLSDEFKPYINGMYYEIRAVHDVFKILASSASLFYINEY
jgi:hypothetical protein